LGWVAENKNYGEAADFDVSAADGVKEGGIRRGAESTRDVGSEGSVFEVDGEGRYRWWEGGENVWGIRVWWEGGGGMWSRHTFSLTRLEPTRTGVGSSRAKMDSVVGMRRQEPEV
jgi:hypothetical protein